MFDEDNKLNTTFGLGYLLRIVSGRKDPAFLKYVLLCAIGLNVLLWLSVFLFSPDIYALFFQALDFSSPADDADDSDLGGLVIVLAVGIGLVLPFSLGFLIVYCIAFMLKPEAEAMRQIDSEFMAGYGYISNEGRVRHLYMLAGAGGALNLFAMIITFHSLL